MVGDQRGPGFGRSLTFPVQAESPKHPGQRPLIRFEESSTQPVEACPLPHTPQVGGSTSTADKWRMIPPRPALEVSGRPAISVALVSTLCSPLSRLSDPQQDSVLS